MVVAFLGRSHSTPGGEIVTTSSGECPLASRFRQSSGRGQPGVDEISAISHPTPARPKIMRLSELIDPLDMAEDIEMAVRSPSGNLLCRRNFEDRDDRPLSMRERQENIRENVARVRALEMAREEQIKTKRRGCFACFGS